MTVPYTFGTATTSIPLSNLDSNFNTPITLGNTSIYLGNTTTTIGNLTLTNVTISSGTANITSNITYATANAVVFTNSSSIGTTSANLTFDGTTVTATKFAGALNGTVGATTASSGAFTTGTFSGAVTLGAISSFGTSLLHTIGGHSFVQGDANATYLYGGAGTGIVLRNSANSATLATFSDSLTTYTSPVTFNAAITLGAVSSFGTGLVHTIGGHNFVQGDATTTYLYGGTGGISFRNATNTSELAIITNAGNVGIGNTNPGSFDSYANRLVVGDGSANQGLTIYGTTTNNIFFAEGTSGAAAYQGFIQYTHVTDKLDFYVNYSGSSSPRMTLDSSGNVLIGSTSVPTGVSQRVLQITNGTNGIVVLGSGATLSPNPRIFGGDTYDLGLAAGVTTGKMVFYTNDTERLRLPAAGGVQAVTTISVGNATPSASGAGVTFPATQSASSDANTLDDYEEGTWNITYVDSVTTNSGSPSYVGYYTKIGRLVNVTMVQTGGNITVIAGSAWGYLPFPPAIAGQACSVTNGSPNISGTGLIYLSSNGGVLYIGFAAAAQTGLIITGTYFTT